MISVIVTEIYLNGFNQKQNRRYKMNEVRFQFHFLIVKFYSSIMDLLSEKCNEHIAKAEKILDEIERYGA